MKTNPRWCRVCGKDPRPEEWLVTECCCVKCHFKDPTSCPGCAIRDTMTIKELYPEFSNYEN